MSKTRSPIIEAVRDTAKDHRKAGVMDRVTLREIDPLWLPPVEPLEPAEIKRIRESGKFNQGFIVGFSSPTNP